MDIVPHCSHYLPKSKICILLYVCGRLYSETTNFCRPSQLSPPFAVYEVLKHHVPAVLYDK